MRIFTAVHNDTGEQVRLTEAQVRTEIINMFQHDMGTVFGDGLSDEQIAADINAEPDVAVYFCDGEFDGFDYTITIFK